MISAFVVSVGLQVAGGYDTDMPADFAWVMLITVAITTVLWLAVAFLTRPDCEPPPDGVYRLARHARAGWAPIAALAPEVTASTDMVSNLVDWIAGCVLIYASLFGVGKLIFQEYLPGLGLLALAGVAGAVIYRDLSRRGWSTV